MSGFRKNQKFIVCVLGRDFGPFDTVEEASAWAASNAGPTFKVRNIENPEAFEAERATSSAA